MPEIIDTSEKRENGFPEWSPITFGDMFKEIKQKTSDTTTYPLYSLTIEDGVTEKTERYERSFLVTKDEDNYKIVPPNAFVYNPMNLRFGALAVNHTGKTVSVSQYYNIFLIKDDSILAFWENYLVMPDMLEFYFSIATGSLLEKRRVYYSDFVKITKSLPSVEEQREISKLLLLYNQKVSLQTYKVSALEQRKIGFLQQIFSQNTQFKMVDNTNYPKWEIVSLGDCCTHVIQKNKERTDLPVYSVNNLVGFTPQSNQFENREVASEDKKNYSVVSYREFAYNPSRINVGSIAFLKENISVIVSPLYVVFKCSGTLMEEFLSLYVRTNEFKTQRKTNTSGSVRDSLSFDGFKEIKIGLPSIEEQAKIVIFFELLDRQIQIERDKLEAMKLVKMGLLQKMFK